MSISVVIPYYNNSGDVDRCLKSILSQTVQPDEVFLIDDCSDDSAYVEKLLVQYINSLNIIYVRNSKNMNGAYSRNYGMSSATSDYIALLDADDFWTENHLELSLSTLLSNSADFTYSNVTIKKEDLLKKVKVDDVNELINPKDIILLSPPQTGSFFFKKSLVTSVLFDEKLRRHQDYQFLLDVILHGCKVVYNDVYTSFYCVSKNQLTRKLDFASIFSFWNKYKDNFSVRPLQEYLIKMLCLNMRTRNEYNIAIYIDQYPVLEVVKGTSFYKLYSVIGDKNFISKTVLFLYSKVRYDLKKKINRK